MPVSWLTRIEEWARPLPLRRQAAPGLYALWHHTHEFEPDGAGGTLMRDTVRYALPFGPLGESRAGYSWRATSRRSSTSAQAVARELT